MGVKKSPILKRNDYIRQFEITVKQEIALHNKKVEKTDQRLCDINKSMANHKKLISDKITQMGVFCAGLRAHFDEEIREIQDRFNIHKKSLESFETKQNLLSEGLDSLGKFVRKLPQIDEIKSDLKCFIDQMNDRFNKNDQGFKDQECDRQTMNKRMENQYIQWSSDFLGVLDAVETQKKIIKEMKDKVKETTFNSDWAKKDMRKKQKAIFILERKFEYVDDKIKKLVES